MKEVKEISKTYEAKGLVLGRAWDGSLGAYPSERIYSDNIEDLKKQIGESIKDGSLDGGFGFRELLGARMLIETIRIIEYKGRNYQNSTFDMYYSKGLSPKQKYFLSRCEI